jgi:hypothetical protein
VVSGDRVVAGGASHVHTPLAAQSASATRETRHVTLTVNVTPRVVTSGDRIAVAIDIVPKPRMHVYAPGSKYRVITIAIEPQPLLTIGKTVYPGAGSYYFKPLKETQPVYDRPFRLQVEMTVGEIGPSADAPSTMTIKGALEYQACDDRACYLPESIPLRWTMKVNARHLAGRDRAAPSPSSGATRS